jgi:hypothetical protein
MGQTARAEHTATEELDHTPANPSREAFEAWRVAHPRSMRAS